MKSYLFYSLDGVNMDFIYSVCSKMLYNEMAEVYGFDHKKYRWYFGYNAFNRLRDIMGLPTITVTPIGDILGIDVVKSYAVEPNEILLRVRPNSSEYMNTFYLDVSSLYPTEFMLPRQSGKTTTSLKLWEETMKNINFNRDRAHDISIKNVIFNDPATIVFWNDGSKTVVKCGEGEVYDPEKGLAMAISKKVLANKGNYYETFKKWLPEKESELKSVWTTTVQSVSLNDVISDFTKAVEKINNIKIGIKKEDKNE